MDQASTPLAGLLGELASSERFRVFADDFPANATTTGVVAVGGSATGNLEVIGDHDWFRVQLSAAYNIRSTNRAAASVRARCRTR